MIKYCKNCVYPDTKPQLVFDEKGVCSACINHDLKEQINWEQKEQELKTIFDEFRSKDGSNYDCIIPVSGGKDSTFQTYFIKKVCGLNPLAVNLHPLDQTEIGKKNLESLKKIGVDCIEFSPNPKVYQKLARYGLKELGDFQWPEHLGIFTVPVQIAVRYNIPLIVWGENPQLEYGKPTDIDRDTILDKEWLEKNGGFFLGSDQSEKLIVRTKTAYDGAIPSGNSVAVMNMVKLSRITGDIKWAELAEKTIRAFSEDIYRAPTGYTLMLSAFLFDTNKSKEIVIVGNIKYEKIQFSDSHGLTADTTTHYNQYLFDMYDREPTGRWVVEICGDALNKFGFECAKIFQSRTSIVWLELGDVTTSNWTVLKKIN